MNIAIISSLKDKASINIKENLINNFNFNKLEEQFDNNKIYQYAINDENIKLYTINSDLINAENIGKEIDADLFIFISKHKAKDERKSLTAHVPGNFGKNEMGGKEKTLCIAPAAYLKNIFIELDKNCQDSEYESSLEVTHHGPFLEKPVLFVEIGSSEKEWEDKNAGNTIAQSVIDAMKKDNKNFNEKGVFIIGGSHYNHVGNKVMLKSDFAVGHICAKYNLENLDESLIRQAMKKTIPEAKFVLLDWKGLGKEKQRILEILEKNGIKYERGDKIFD